MGEYLNQFKLGDFVVDFDRCQVELGGESISVEPKVMDMLCYLSKRPGKVVSQQALFSAIWPNAIYNPSSVQRCIALMRKALKEDAKNPKLIITHPKRGYSLEIPAEPLSINDSLNKNSPERNKLIKGTILFAGVMSVVLVIFLLLKKSADVVIKEHYSELLPIVSTGKKELFPRYSPDGQYIAYIARVEGKKYHIWIKDLNSGKVTRLSDNPSNYKSISWSNDQHALNFVERIEHGDRVGRLPFNRYQSEPVTAQVLLSLKNEHITGQVQWMKNGEAIFAILDNKNSTRLVHYTNEMNVKNVLVEGEQLVDFIDIALSNDNRLLAFVNRSKPNHYPIRILDLETSKLKELAVLNGNVNGLNWHPTDTSLLVSNRTKLRLIDLLGETKDLNFSNYLNISNASYSPDGERIAMTLFSIDTDIVASSINRSSEEKVVVNSKSIDMQPLYSPDSSKFAFVSLRSGNQQVFLYENGIEQLLFKNSENKEFFGMAWSPNGQRIAITMDDTLYTVNIDNGAIERSIKHGISSMYLRGWYQHDNALLVSLPGRIAAKFDLDSLTATKLIEEPFHCIALDLNDNIYLNQKSKVVKLNREGESSLFWQSDSGDIEHVFVNDDDLFVEFDKIQEPPFLKINLEKKAPAEHLALEIGEHSLADISSDGSQFLIMTWSNTNSTVFTLQ